MRLALIILAVRDLSRAVTFYRAAFGWAQTVDVPVYAEFALPGSLRLGLYQREGFGRNTGQLPMAVPEGGLSGTELYLYTEDLPSAATRLMELGARQLSPIAQRDWGDEVAYFADPDGNVLALARPIEPEDQVEAAAE
jgi:predicted enzyme related to lactoylglutathione lyase